MTVILVWLGKLYTGFTLSSHGYFAGGSVISVKFNWPIFTVLMSMSQWVCFHLGTMYANNGWISESDFVANHLKRHQIWRQFSYLFVHDNQQDLWDILWNQILMGCCLEIINGWKPVVLVYFGGAFVSDMIDFFSGSAINGYGASGGVTSLYSAYLATIILNWKETSGATVRTLYILYYMLLIFTPPVWNLIMAIRLGTTEGNNVSHAASVGGAFGGFIFGLSFVKIFRKRLWKNKIQKNYRYVATILLAFVTFSLFCDPFVHSKFIHDKYIANVLDMPELPSQKY